MKKLPVFFALFLLLMVGSKSHGQKKIGGFLAPHKFFHSVVLPAPKPAPVLEGRWIRTYDNVSKDRLVFTLAKENELRWGNYLEFLPGREVAKGYSAPCGNDTNIHRHAGSYKVQFNTILIDLGQNGTLSYRIIEQKADSLVLQPLN